MNKNKVLLMYFTVFVGSLTAPPDHDLSSSDSSDEECPTRTDYAQLCHNFEQFQAYLKNKEVLKSALLALPNISEGSQELIKHIEGMEKTKVNVQSIIDFIGKILEPKPIRNLEECCKLYNKLGRKFVKHKKLKILTEKLPWYETRLERLVEFMNHELSRIKMALEDRYSHANNLEDEALRKEFFEIQGVYYRHLNLCLKLQVASVGQEDRVDLPHCGFIKYDQMLQIKGLFYQIYSNLAEISIKQDFALLKKQKKLQDEWKQFVCPVLSKHGTMLDDGFVPHMNQRTQNDQVLFTLFRWEVEGILKGIKKVTNHVEPALYRSISLWEDKVSKIQGQIQPIPALIFNPREEEECRRELMSDLQSVSNVISDSFSLSDPTLWPAILELMIYVTEVILFSRPNYPVISFVRNISYPLSLKQMDAETKKTLDHLTAVWLNTLVLNEYCDWKTSEVLIKTMNTLLDLDKAGYQFRVRLIIAIMRMVVDPKKFPPRSSDAFKFQYDADGSIIGKPLEILELKS